MVHEMSIRKLSLRIARVNKMTHFLTVNIVTIYVILGPSSGPICRMLMDQQVKMCRYGLFFLNVIDMLRRRYTMRLNIFRSSQKCPFQSFYRPHSLTHSFLSSTVTLSTVQNIVRKYSVYVKE